MYAKDILNEAAEIIDARGFDYGYAPNNMAQTAALVSEYLDYPVNPSQMAGIMVLVKLARTKESPSKLDHWVDLCGYASIAGHCATENEPK